MQILESDHLATDRHENVASHSKGAEEPLKAIHGLIDTRQRLRTEADTQMPFAARSVKAPRLQDNALPLS